MTPVLPPAALAGPQLVSVSLAARGGRTGTTFRQSGFGSAGSRDGHEEGWSETFLRLAEYLETMG